jgi:hypothetical protein
MTEDINQIQRNNLRLKKFFKRIDINGFPIPISISSVKTGTLLTCTIAFNTYDRETFQNTTLMLPFTLDLLYEYSFNEFANIVRKHIHKAFMHEIDEWFLVDGVRRYDPHKKDKQN